MNAALIQTPPSRIDAPPQAHALLDEALHAIRLQRTAECLFAAHPSLGTAARRLAWMVTRVPRHPFTGSPILDTALKVGLVEGFTASQEKRNLVKAFIGEALTHACTLLEIEIRHGVECWNHHSDGPLGVWLERRPHAISGPRRDADVTLSPRAFYANLCLRIVDPEDINDLRDTIEAGGAL